MLEYLPLILNFAVVFFSLIWIQHDLSKVEIGMENKLFWLWSIGVLIGWFLLAIMGMVIVLVTYYFWRRNRRA